MKPADLFGPWACLPEALHGYVDLAGRVALAAEREKTRALPVPPAYTITPEGVAILSVSGPMTKGVSSLAGLVGGTSTIATRANARQALRDTRVNALLLMVDSPGGTVSGTGDLADTIAAANAVKPVVAFIEDLGASAAYWVASQCAQVVVNPSGMVGSIGTYAVLEDSSGKAEAEGVKVHVVRAGALKGIGTPGAPITSSDLAAVQDRVNSLNDVFLAAVARGRRMPAAKVRALADGRMWVGHEAQANGLVDAVGTLPDAIARAVALARASKPAASTPVPAPAQVATIATAPTASAVPLALRRPTPKPAATVLPFAEVTQYESAIRRYTAQGYSRQAARGRVDREAPTLRASVGDRLRKQLEAGGERAAEVAAVLAYTPDDAA